MQGYKWWKNEFPDVKFKKSKSLLHNFQTKEIDGKGLAINPYVGCQHRCLYCYATYDWYPDFYDTIYVKINAKSVLKRELPLYGSKEPVMIGSSTDSYQVVELKFRITKEIIETLQQYNVAYYIFTKSTAVLVDKELHARYKSKCFIVWSLTTLDEEVKRKIEPFAASAESILRAMKKMREEGIVCGINIDPIMPGINDDKKMLEELIDRAKEADCCFISAGILRLRKDIWERMKAFFKNENPSLIELYHKLYFENIRKSGCYLLAKEEYCEDILNYIEEKCKLKGISFGLPFNVPGIESSCYLNYDKQRSLLEYCYG